MRGIDSCAHCAEERVLSTEPQDREFLPGILHLLLSQQLILAHGLDSEDRSLAHVARDRGPCKTHTAVHGLQSDRRNIEGITPFGCPHRGLL